MVSFVDFVRVLDRDMTIIIFMYLNDPSDLARVCSVSSSWHDFVITNELFKLLCLKNIPEIASAVPLIESNANISPIWDGWVDFEWRNLVRNHKVYAYLTRGLTSSIRSDLIVKSICASSTDNYPKESIDNTLVPFLTEEFETLYWSSKGACDPSTRETLTYKLKSNMCLITEIHMQALQAYFQQNIPIYSPKGVKFKIGQTKYLQLPPRETRHSASVRKYTDDWFTWSYESPEFPMTQEGTVQKFKLPEPVLGIGDILQVELIGMVQRQVADGLYYICISNVQVVGRPLRSSFICEKLDRQGKCILKYIPESEQTASDDSGDEMVDVFFRTWLV